MGLKTVVKLLSKCCQNFRNPYVSRSLGFVRRYVCFRGKSLDANTIPSYNDYKIDFKTYENDMVKAFGRRQKEIAEEKEVCQDACKFRWFQTYFF
ncbi:hypothetical protein LC724_30540 [Blautia sp. RD014234]|nr:hypothetical protein [Blautia parvula]